MRQDAIAMRGRMIHPHHPPDSSAAAPRTIFQPYSHDPKDAINSVSRGGLNQTLIKAAAEHANVEFVFDHPCVDVDLAAPAGFFQKPGGGTVRVEADLIIGADGAFSAVRGKLQITDRYDYSQSYLEHGYKELHIPAGAGGFAMEPNALHIWPRGGAMMIALPNRDQTFTCTLFWPFKGEHGFEPLKTPEQVAAFFKQHYADAMPLMPTLTEDFFRNPTSSLVTVRCWPWRVGGNVVLLGDAAHAIVPFYGQGMNAAFEDCLLLARLLNEHKPARAGGRLDFGDALERYQRERKPNADAIADMALENFVEMRDKTGSPAFLYRKKIEQTVHHFFPDRVTPQYNLVSFSTVPYVEARRRGRALDEVLNHVVARWPMETLSSLGAEAWSEAVRGLAGELLAEESSRGGAEAPRSDKTGSDSSLRAFAPVRESFFDITPAVTEKLGVWPGDTKLSREVLCDIAKGDNITLSTLRATVHLGAHADGPNHYGKDQPGIGERDLRHYVGGCQVVEARVGRGRRIAVGDLAWGLETIRQPRVLLKTLTFPDPNNWNSDFAGLSVELVEALAARGVITIGIDTPSVDLQDSKDLPAHHAILRHGIAILEGLDLSHVAPGDYELIAAPLKLMGFDASPVRAVLRPLARA
jgi:kynurenine 3-monooxygenase